MILGPPLSDRGSPIEFFNKHDWMNVYSMGDVERGTALTLAKRPFQTMPLLATWSFDKATQRLNFFDTPSPLDVLERNSKYLPPQFEFFVRWTDAVRQARRHPYCLNDVLGMIERSDWFPEEDMKELATNVIARKSHLELDWAEFRNSFAFALYDRRDFAYRPADAKKTVYSCLRQIYDYGALHAALWDSLPREYMTALFPSEDNANRALFGAARAFDPVMNPNGGFRWPWQSCLSSASAAPDCPIEIEHRAIRTTSIVMDLRHSTVAMNLTQRPEAYADFIDSVVRDARKILIEEGGFFDKETGDGLVGHFCDAETLVGIERDYCAVKQAFAAARRIVLSVREKCSRYQDELLVGIGGLGASIGIHSETATWLAGAAQVRAIGPSVVVAARLCGCAASGQIMFSNHSFRLLRESVPAEAIADTRKIDIEMQEYDAGTGLYAYAYDC